METTSAVENGLADLERVEAGWNVTSVTWFLRRLAMLRGITEMYITKKSLNALNVTNCSGGKTI